MLTRKEKEQLVANLTGELAEAKAAFLADYRGISVEQVNALRTAMREAGGQYCVVKNTLLRRAIEGTAAQPLHEWLDGPTALTIAAEDPVAPAKVLKDFVKKVDNFNIKGGVLDGKPLTAEQVDALASLPSREELLQKMLGSMNAPAQNMAGVLAAVPRSFVQVLQAIHDQKAA